MGNRESTILVVDDESSVRRTLAAMLAHHGYTAVTAAGGEEAVAACWTRGDGFRAAVLDVRMPGMDGPAVLAALRDVDPALPCVFLTGDAGPYSTSELRACGAAAVLAKPVPLCQLGEAVAAAIAAAG